MTESGLKLIGAVLVTSLAWTAASSPQPISAWEMPSLVLDRRAVAEATAADQEAAASLPQDENVTALWDLFVEDGHAEIGGTNDSLARDQRYVRIIKAMNALESKYGPQVKSALRARAVEVSERVASSGTEDERAGVFGALPKMFELYGVVYRGVPIAPRLVRRALFKARWNVVYHLDVTDGLSRIEQQAYWGWLALHASRAPIDRRREALAHFAAVGGVGASEAAALYAILSRQPQTASRMLRALYERSGELRLRNLAFGAIRDARLEE